VNNAGFGADHHSRYIDGRKCNKRIERNIYDKKRVVEDAGKLHYHKKCGGVLAYHHVHWFCSGCFVVKSVTSRVFFSLSIALEESLESAIVVARNLGTY